MPTCPAFCNATGTVASVAWTVQLPGSVVPSFQSLALNVVVVVPDRLARSQYQSVVVCGELVVAAARTVLVPPAVSIRLTTVLPAIVNVSRAW
jgi:hypothetical protein